MRNTAQPVFTCSKSIMETLNTSRMCEICEIPQQVNSGWPNFYKNFIEVFASAILSTFSGKANNSVLLEKGNFLGPLTLLNPFSKTVFFSQKTFKIYQVAFS